MSLRRRLIVALAVLLAGCGGGDGGASPQVDAEQVEGLLVQRQKERNPRLRVGEASCPAGVTARSGERFECSLDVEGETARFTVTVAEVLGRRARYEFRPVQAIIDVAAVADFVRSRLDEEWRRGRVDCGPAKVRLMDVGAVLDCTATNGPSTRRIQAVVEDANGTVNLRER